MLGARACRILNQEEPQLRRSGSAAGTANFIACMDFTDVETVAVQGHGDLQPVQLPGEGQDLLGRESLQESTSKGGGDGGSWREEQLWITLLPSDAERGDGTDLTTGQE